MGVKGDGPGDKVDPSDYIDHRAEERTALHFHRHVGGVSTRVHKLSEYKQAYTSEHLELSTLNSDAGL